MARLEDPVRLPQQRMRALLEEIARGRYSPGTRLPPEKQLAVELGVSRGVVRELLRGLESRGVVSIRPARGAWVRATADWNVLDAEVLAALMPTLASVGILEHYVECRRMLEVESAALAADRASSSDLSELADVLAQMNDLAVNAETSGEAERLFHETDIAFHGAIFRASGNQVLAHLVEPIQRAMATLRPELALHPEDRLQKTLPEHKAILAALADHNPDGARAAMSAHLDTVENYLREYRRQRGTSAKHSLRSGATDVDKPGHGKHKSTP